MRVCIGGLIPRQERVIEASCPDGVELRFVSSDVSPAQWARVAKNCDHTIVVTKFVSHKHTDALHAAKVPYIIMASGGTGALTAAIEALAQGTFERSSWHK